MTSTYYLERPSQTNGATTCAACAAGKYQNEVGQTSCEDCPAGTAGDANGVRQCVNSGCQACQHCAAGKSTDAAGSSACASCGRGKFSVVATVTVVDAHSVATHKCTGACPVGKYGAVEGGSSEAAACTICVAGKTTELPRVVGAPCVLCAAGKYSDAATLGVCQSCSAGTFAVAARDSCQQCVAGKYQDEMEQGSCKDCLAGNRAVAGSAACTQCATGKFLGLAAAGGTGAACQPCADGHVATAVGSAACTSCSTGETHNNARDACEQCPAGKWSNAGGACQVCEGNQTTSASGLWRDIRLPLCCVLAKAWAHRQGGFSRRDQENENNLGCVLRIGTALLSQRVLLLNSAA